VRNRITAIALVLLGTATCGGGSGHSSRQAVLGDAFQSRARAVCAAALAQKKARGAFPYPDFNPTKPDPSKLPGIAAFEAKTVTIYQTWLREMQALGQPPTGRGLWGDVVGAVMSHTRIIVEQQAAAQRGDAQTFTKDYYDGNRAQDAMLRASSAAGVPVCAAAAAA